MSTTQELQQEIIQAEAKINALREKLNERKNTERLQVIESIKELVKLHELSANDLGFSGKSGAAPKKRARTDKGMAVAPKFADPATGKTWAGRGRMPDWLNKYLLAGKTKQDYLIKN